MPYTFLVGTADVPGANSYASVEEYRDFFRVGTSDGTDLSAVADEALQDHLVNATRFLDQLRWNGRPKHDDNVRRLALPRYELVVGPGNAFYQEGTTLDSAALPWVVRDAVIYLAEAERVSGNLLWRPKKDRDQILSRKRSIVGSEKTFAKPLAARHYPQAMSLVAGLHTANRAGARVIAV